MGVTAASLHPADYAVMGVAGGAALLALQGAGYSVPWRARHRRAKGAREFNLLWRGRAALALLLALWAASQLLRLGSLWGRDSVAFPLGSPVTSWTGSGWMCRVYLTVGPGLLQPLCSLTTLLLLATAVSQRAPPAARSHPNARVLGAAALLCVPIVAVQAAVAWLSAFVHYRGQAIEAAPRSVLGYFFAVYWEGSPQQCGPSAPGCTLCVFPAAMAAAHAVWTAGVVVALWLTASRAAAAVLNVRLRARLRALRLVACALAAGGAGAVGASVAWGPFSWANQGCWLGYVATVAATVALVTWHLVVSPVRELRAVSKQLGELGWADDGLDYGGGGSSPGGSGAVLIKARHASQQPEAYAAAGGGGGGGIGLSAHASP